MSDIKYRPAIMQAMEDHKQGKPISAKCPRCGGNIKVIDGIDIWIVCENRCFTNHMKGPLGGAKE